jgi:hypothetical protein
MQCLFSRARRIGASASEKEMTPQPPLTRHAPRRALAARLEVACLPGSEVLWGGVPGTLAARGGMPHRALPARCSGRVVS